MRKFILDGTVFQDEFGTLTPNAFEVLNHTFSNKYGSCQLFRDAVNLVYLNFEIIADNRQNKNYRFNSKFVVEHFEKLTKSYYEILELRKKKDYELKLNDIDNDF